MERTMVATSDPCVSLASPTPSTFLVSRCQRGRSEESSIRIMFRYLDLDLDFFDWIGPSTSPLLLSFGVMACVPVCFRTILFPKLCDGQVVLLFSETWLSMYSLLPNYLCIDIHAF
jgi:hypothetical protein